MTSTAGSGSRAKVDDVLITAELASRPSASPDYEAESRALDALAQEMAANPRGVLQKCAELALELCHADSAGISILEPGGTSGLFRWHAAAGAFAPNLHGSMPREASPCGTVIERNSVLLFNEAERFFPALRGLEPRIYENLLTPWHVKGEAVGTLWAIKHTAEGRFDAEDARILQSLARFAAAAFQMSSALDEAAAERASLRESEERYRSLFNAVSQGLAINQLVRDEHGRVVDARYLDLNPAYEAQTRFERSKAIGRLASEVFPLIEPFWLEMAQRVVETRQPEHTERFVADTDRWFSFHVAPFEGTDQFVVLYDDITDRKRAETTLRDSEDRQRFLLTMGDALRRETSAIGKIEIAARHLGERLAASRVLWAEYDHDKGLAHIFSGWFADGARPYPAVNRLEDFEGDVLNDLRAGRTVRVDDVGALADRPGYAEISKVGVQALLSVPLLVEGRLAVNISVHQHEPRRWTDEEVALASEVAERLWAEVVRARAEDALRTSEEQSRDALDSLSEGFALLGSDFTILDINAETVRLDGRSREEIVGRNHWEAFPGSEDSPQGEMFKRVMRDRVPAAMEHSYQWPDGKTLWIDTRAYPTAHGRVGLLWRDITERKQTEQALRESEAKFRTLFESIDEGFAIVEMIYGEQGEIADMIFRQVNAAYERQTGVAGAVGRSIYDIIPDVEDYWIDAYKRVASTGQPARLESYQRDVDMWFDVHFTRVDEDGRYVAIVFNNTTDRKRAEATLREHAERQAFLLMLSDSLRATSADTIIARAVAMLTDKLGLDLCYVVTVCPEKDRADVVHQLRRRSDIPGVPVTIRLSDYPKAFLQWQERTPVSEDMAGDPALTERDRQNVAAMGFGALIAAPVRCGHGNPVWSIVAVMAQARRWTSAEVALVEETAERTWAAVARARTEAALRESEERLSLAVQIGQFASWDWDLRSDQVSWNDRHFNVQEHPPNQAMPGFAAWLARVHPEDRNEAISVIEKARAEKGLYNHDFRMLLTNGKIRWCASRGRFFYDAAGEPYRMIGVLQDVTERKQAEELQKTLLAELQHRVRNILAVVRSIISRSDDGELDTEAYVQHLQGRISALARTQVLLTRKVGVGVDLEEIVRNELLSQVARDEQFEVAGPDVTLSAKAAEVLTLAIHELATNATKYGAFSMSTGRLRVDWTIEFRNDERWLVLTWKEQGVPIVDVVPRRRGFGAELISRRVPYELKGYGSFELKPGGIESRIEFPLRPGRSVLQTDGV